MANRIENWGVGQFLACFRRAQHNPTAAHFAPAHEVGWKEQPHTKHLEQGVDVLWGCNTAEQNDITRIPELLKKQAAVTIKGSTVPPITRIDIVGCPLTQLIAGHNGIGPEQPRSGGNHECAGKTCWSCRKCPRIRELAAKVESADKTEQLTQWQALAPEAACEVEVSALVQDISRANTSEIRGRK